MLKQLIQRLLDSRTTPSEASHSSYPDDGTVTQFSPSATSVSSWTKVVDSTIAPSDGYVIVRGKATGESYVQITAGDNPPHMERSTFAKTTLNQYPILNLPIAKGKTFKVFAENTAEITVGLIKSICGGGYKYVVRRALSCLKPSFNFSQRSFFKVNIPTLLIKSEEKALHKQRLQSLILPSSITPLLTQGMSYSECHLLKTLGLGLRTKQAEPATLLMQQERGKRRHSLSRKGTLLSSVYPKPPKLPKRHVRSYHACVNLNLRQGGASC